MLVTELVSTTWDTHVTLHCGHYSTQTYDAHDWSVASQTLLGPIKIRPVVCKICIEQPILRAKLTSSINYLLYWLRSSVSHILLKNSWRSNALAFSTGKSATQAILLMKMSGRLDHTGLVSPFFILARRTERRAKTCGRHYLTAGAELCTPYTQWANRIFPGQCAHCSRNAAIESNQTNNQVA